MIKAKKTLIVFPDSEEEIYLPNVSTAGLILKVQRKIPKPEPPRQKVNYGDGVDRWETNYADPDYKINLAAWSEYTITEAIDLAIKQLYKKTTLTADQKAAVDEWKEQNQDEVDEADSDVSLWFEQVALSTYEDFQALTNFLNGVKEEDVDSIQDSFPGDAGE